MGKPVIVMCGVVTGIRCRWSAAGQCCRHWRCMADVIRNISFAVIDGPSGRTHCRLLTLCTNAIIFNVPIVHRIRYFIPSLHVHEIHCHRRWRRVRQWQQKRQVNGMFQTIKPLSVSLGTRWRSSSIDVRTTAGNRLASIWSVVN